MNSIPPTKKQKEILDYIQKFIRMNGYSPSYREIAEALKYDAHSTVAMHVRNLIEKGYLVSGDRGSRSIGMPSASSNELALVEKVQKAFDEIERPASKEDLKRLSAMVDGLEAFGLQAQADQFSSQLRSLIQDVL